MVELVDQTRQMQEKLADLEGRSRRNNIRIFGLPEDTEGSSFWQIRRAAVDRKATTAEDTDLQIQCAHWALAQKPNPNRAT